MFKIQENLTNEKKKMVRARARACTPFTKSEEEEVLLAVYL